MQGSPEANASSDPLVGRLLAGRYRILAPVSRGAMGRVYRAEQVPLGRVVAVKILDAHSDNASQDAFQKRFLQEASFLAALHHQHTVRVHDYGVWDGMSCLVMEYVDGRTLTQVMGGHRLPPARMIRIAIQVAGALREAHDHGIVHRDLKPTNLLVRRGADGEDEVKVIDFGLVKRIDETDELTQAGTLVGTPMYIAPEAIVSDTLDHRVDVYALGVLLYLGLTGHPPWPRRRDPQEMLQVVLAREPRPFDEVAPDLVLPRAVEWTVRAMLAKRPEQRPTDMREVNRALRACLLAIEDPETSAFDLSLDQGRVVLPAGLEENSQHTMTRVVVKPPPDRWARLRIAALVLLLVLAAAAGMWFGGRAERGATEPIAATVDKAPEVPVVATPPPGIAPPAVVEPEPAVVAPAPEPPPPPAEERTPPPPATREASPARRPAREDRRPTPRPSSGTPARDRSGAASETPPAEPQRGVASGGDAEPTEPDAAPPPPDDFRIDDLVNPWER